ncbi:hypothetical protein GF373_14880, partial [bacterium]|nr:hypothetical protein [bacterium]
MKTQIVKFIPFFLVTSMVFFFECPDAFGQYNSRYNQGYGNSYSGNRGYNQGYNSGGLNRGGLGSSRMGGSRFGSSSFGSQSYGGSRMGSSRMGSSRMGSSRRGSSRYGGYNQSGGYDQGGYNQSGYNSRGRSSRNSRYNRNSSAGSSYVPQSAQQPAIGGMQTTPGASSSDRRRALSGKTGLGALPPSSKSGKSDSRAGGIQILGKAQAGKQAAPGKKRAPSKKGAKKKAPTQSVATYYLSSLNTVALLNQPMTVDIVLSNPKKLGFNKFGFMLEYNPDILVPITEFDEENNKPILAYELVTSASAEQAEEAERNQTSAEKNNLAPSFLLAETKHTYQITQNEIQPGKGIIQFEAQVKNESSTDQGIVAQVTFLPVKETKNSSITFSFQDDDNDNQPPTFLLENGNDQLGSGFNPIDGTVNYDFT